MPRNSGPSREQDKAFLPTRSDVPLTDRVGGVFRARWNPIPEPFVDADLASLPFLQKSAEVVRYQFHKLEYSISSGGSLRAWFKLNLFVAILLAIPAFLLVPVITVILAGVAEWTLCLMQIVQHLLFTLLYLIAIAVIISTAIYLFIYCRSIR